jgi:hypothetical protein
MAPGDHGTHAAASLASPLALSMTGAGGEHDAAKLTTTSVAGTINGRRALDRDAVGRWGAVGSVNGYASR